MSRNTHELIVDPERLSLFLDTDLRLTVELGRTQMTLEKLIGLDEGSVVEFPSRLEEPLQVSVNGIFLGHCDLVPGDGPIHVRIVELQSGPNAARTP